MNNDFEQKNNLETTSKTDGKPLVSVNICTHNRSDLISKAIESVLEQTYPNIEIIIADDGDDDTEKVVKELIEKKSEWKDKIHYHKNPNSGIPQNRNFALEKSNGDYIAVLDSDDYWISPSKIDTQIDFITTNKDYVLVGTNAVIIDDKNKMIGKIINKQDDEKIRANFLLKNHFINSTTLFVNNPNLKYEENFPFISDYDFFLEIAKTGKVTNLSDLTLAYKNHPDNVSNKKRIEGIKTGFKIINKHKNDYPKYYLGLIKNSIRYIRSLLPF